MDGMGELEKVLNAIRFGMDEGYCEHVEMSTAYMVSVIDEAVKDAEAPGAVSRATLEIAITAIEFYAKTFTGSNVGDALTELLAAVGTTEMAGHGPSKSGGTCS